MLNNNWDKIKKNLCQECIDKVIDMYQEEGMI